MPKMTIEFKKITATFLIRKDFYNEEKLNIPLLKERIQQGIEVPIEKIDIKIGE